MTGIADTLKIYIEKNCACEAYNDIDGDKKWKGYEGNRNENTQKGDYLKVQSWNSNTHTLSKSRKASLAKLFPVDVFTATPRCHKKIYTFMKARSPTA